MNQHPGNPPQTEDASKATDWLVSFLRWPWLIIALLIIWLEPRPAPLLSPYAYYVVAGGALLSFIHLGLLQLGRYPNWLRVAGTVADTLVAVLLLIFSGGWQGHMLPAVLFPVTMAAWRFGVEAGMAVAVPLVLTYGGSVAVDRTLTTLADLYPVGVDALLILSVAGVVGTLQHAQRGQAVQVESSELMELRRANQRAKVIHEMAATLSATLDYKRVLRAMLDLGFMAISEISKPDPELIGLVMLFEEEGIFDRLRVHAGRNIPRADENSVIAVHSGLIARAIYSAEPTFGDLPASDPALSQLVCMQAARSALCVPLRAGFDIFGVVVLASAQPGYFGAEHAELMATFCNQAVIALKNAQLYQELQAEQRKLLETEAEARHNLARELHDGPTQTISAIAMRLNFARMMLEKNQPSEKVMEELALIEEMARKTTQEVRTMLFALRPVILETQGLVAALKQYADRLRQADNLNVQVETVNYAGQLGREAEGVVFSVIEEAVGNARKHAQANTIKVRVWMEGLTFFAEVQDDGVGFDAEAAERRREAGHLGLLNMQERAEYLGGRCTVQSKPGAGTRVRLEIPLKYSAVSP